MLIAMENNHLDVKG